MYGVIIDITTESSFRYKELVKMPRDVLIDLWQQVTTPLEHRIKLQKTTKEHKAEITAERQKTLNMWGMNG